MSIILENLTRRIDGHPVVNNVSLNIAKGQFFVLLGPSGSGKTTILNLIAGLAELDQGKISLHGRDVTHLPPQARHVGYVFQHYALFQQMTVNENIDFGPSAQKVPRAERQQRREKLLDLVNLTGLGNRYPYQLSGGQQQRVALARALALEPDVLLLDEPFGALDAKIRVELRRTLRAIQQQLGITSILVTHDQEEAFDLADCIGIMNYGRLIEVGTPRTLYQYPQSEFVASFLGTANLLVTNQVNDGFQLGPNHIRLPQPSTEMETSTRIQVLFRPEDVALAASSEELTCDGLGMADVEEVSYVGSIERLRLRLPPIKDVRPIAPAVPFGSRSIVVEATRSPDEAARFTLASGDSAWVGIRRFHALANPGFQFLVVTDGSLKSHSSLDLAGQVARVSHARVTLLGCSQPGEFLDPHLQEMKKQLGGGLSAVHTCVIPDLPLRAISKVVEQQPYDLVVLGCDEADPRPVIEQVFKLGEFNLLLSPQPKDKFKKMLICLTNDDTGKNGIYFPGRLAYHLGMDATLMAVFPSHAANRPADIARAEHFLSDAANTISLFTISTGTKVRCGEVYDEIMQEVKEGNYDLLVISAPVRAQAEEMSLYGAIDRIVREPMPCSVLLVHHPLIKDHSSPK